MNELYPYDSVVIFPSPLYLPRTGNENWTEVYGILFNNDMKCTVRNENSIITTQFSYPQIIDIYVGYLHGCHNFFKNGGKIDDGLWTTHNGKQYIEDVYVRTLISMVQKLDYKVLTCDEPIETKKGETEQDWIISKDLMERIRQHLP